MQSTDAGKGRSDKKSVAAKTAIQKTDDGKYRVVVMAPLSGQGAQMGQAMLNAAMLSLNNHAKASNIRPGDVIIIPKDSGSSSEEAGYAAASALKAGGNIILGPVFSDSLQGVLPYAARGVPIISFSNNPQMAGKGAYLSGFMPDQQIKSVLAFAISQGKHRVSALLPNDAYGRLISGALEEYAAENEKLKLAHVEFYSPDGSDLPAKVAGIMELSADMDALLIPEGGERLRVIANMLPASKSFQILGSGQWDDPATLSLGSLNGAWFASSDPVKRRSFENTYASSFGGQPPRLASLAYDAMAMIVKFKSEGVGAAEIATRLNSGAEFDAPADGRFKVMPTGVFQRGLVVLEVTPGGFKLVSYPQI